MKHNARAIRAIALKDLGQVLRNKTVWLPMILLPLILQVILPAAMTLLPTFVPSDDMDMDELVTMMATMPGELRSALEGLSEAQAWVMISSNYMFAPLFLIVPLMVSSIIAADGFVGERERRTMEALLYSPVSDQDLFLAKLLAAWVPAVVISWGAFLVNALVVNLTGYRIMGRIFFPQPMWWGMLLWLGPGLSLTSLGATVLISAKAKTFMQAQQMSGMLVLPVVLLMIGQVSGLLFICSAVVWLLGIPVWLLGVWLVWIGSHSFKRDELIGRV